MPVHFGRIPVFRRHTVLFFFCFLHRSAQFHPIVQHNPKLPFKADSGTVPEYSTVQYRTVRLCFREQMNRTLGPGCIRTHLSAGPWARETTLHTSKQHQITRSLRIHLLIRVKSAETTDGIHFQLALILRKFHTRQKPACTVWRFFFATCGVLASQMGC